MLRTSSLHSATQHRLSAVLRHLRPQSTTSLSASSTRAWICRDLNSVADFRRYLLKCRAVSKPLTPQSVIRWNEFEDEEIVPDEATKFNDSTTTITEQITEQIELVRSMLRSMSDGEISASAYDVAWVALVEDISSNGRRPQFPLALQWISNNQHPDGSWGDSILFSAHDRILCTLASITSLKTWNALPDKVQSGLKFIEQNMGKLEDEKEVHMPIGFEIIFPNLLELAKGVNIVVPDSPFLKDVFAKRNLKLTRIPKDLMHVMPTTLLHSLEGMVGLDWEKLLQLQCEDGSFLFSPSSTAYALMQTKDYQCLNYIEKIVQRFQGGVPTVYPVDIFERIWAIDKLQRLGISRYFQNEINRCLHYVYSYWTEKGICWARNTNVEDIDDTAMGFRLLRLHGFKVSPDVFRNFKKGDEFVCVAGQSSGAVTGIYNLYRASQIQFPNEKILDDAKNYAHNYLIQKQACNELFDKWIIKKDLPGEVGYALDIPWYASLPRLESRIYIEQYEGANDVWIGKTLYRMPFVNNDTYLELAKSDYNECQAIHQLEVNSLEKWYLECGIFEELCISRRSLLVSYYLAAASIFEPERSAERLAWAKSAILIESVVSYIHSDKTVVTEQKKISLLNYEFTSKKSMKLTKSNTRNSLNENKLEKKLALVLLKFLQQMSSSLDSRLAVDNEKYSHLCQAWEKWMITIGNGGGKTFGQETDLLVETVLMMSSDGRRGMSFPDILSHRTYILLSTLTNKLCGQLRDIQNNQILENEESRRLKVKQSVDLEMQRLMQLVLQKSDVKDDLDVTAKQIFLTVARSFYYISWCNPVTVNDHIAKVLFQRVK